MSSLHQDHRLVEGSGPVAGTATPRGTSRPAAGPPEGRAATKVPAQRQRTAQRSGTSPSTATAPAAPRADRATGVEAAAPPGKLASRAKAATVRAATAKAATAKAAEAATAARGAAVTTVADRTAAVRSARSAAVASAGAGATRRPARKGSARTSVPATGGVPAGTARPIAEATAAEPAAAGAAGPRVRPTPYKRVLAAQAAPMEPSPRTDVADLDVAGTPDVVVREDLPAGADAASRPGNRLPLFLRRPRSARRRPAVLLTAAVVSAISLSGFTEEPAAPATATVSQSVSVAEQLGIESGATSTVVDADVTERLVELAASRNLRDAEQAAAAQVQAEADRVAAAAAAAAAAEAARPKAVLPVQGARLTSGFGPRWGALHAGIDLAAPMHTPEYAVMDGVVLEAGPASGYGLVVYIQHHNGDVTVYGHMDEILVEAGQVVRAGDTIALLGNRGQSTGPHLHFEVHAGGLDGQKVDPLLWLRDKGLDV